MGIIGNLGAIIIAFARLGSEVILRTATSTLIVMFGLFSLFFFVNFVFIVIFVIFAFLFPL
jgi:hypothetical protein